MSPEKTSQEPSAVSLELRWLTPEFNEEQHGIYRATLLNALTSTDRGAPTNIAVTGPYGSGKSSILRKIADDLPARTASVSLSSLGGDEPSTLGDGDTAKPSSPKVTRFIQKEIVKQLLYSQPPETMRGSRYRRATAFQPRDALLWALVGALGGGLFLFIAGGEQRVEQLIPDALGSLRPLVWVAGVVLLGIVIYLTQSWAHGRFHLEKLTAGPATITLTDKSAYYFDEFLDDIVFYFQRTGTNVVIFEDLDRFDNAHIFDTLRELNTILNNASQLDARPIRFVYAIKDSMFEQLGEEKKPVRATESATNRTKFFELVVPIVPFISHRTARDLIEPEMEGATPELGGSVIQVVARHVTDMRLIKNIRNEYDIFSRMIMRPDGIKNLTADSLFAMIVYKNLHLGDFEKIINGTSNLDTLYTLMRTTVADNLAHIEARIGDHRRQLDQAEKTNERTARLSERLIATLDFSSGQTSTIQADGETFGRAAWSTVQFWQSVSRSESVILTSDRGAAVRRPLGDLENLLGTKIAVDSWTESETERLLEVVASLTERKSALRRANLSQLLRGSALTTNPLAKDDERTVFSDDVDAVLASPLASDLVRAGYINENFGLYAARYYGRTLSANAMTFIIKVVQPRTADYSYHFDAINDIDQLVAAAGDDLRNERAIYNIEIFDHLLLARPAALDDAFRRLSTPTDTENEFLDVYVRNGTEAGTLVSRLADSRPDIFEYLDSVDGLSESETDQFLSAALTGARSQPNFYTIGDPAKDRFLGRIPDLDAFTSAASDESALTLAHVVTNLGLQLPDLRPVATTQRRELVACNAFVINRTNVLVLTGDASISLDAVRSAVPNETYAYICSRLGDYLGALEPDDQALDSPETFDEVISDLAGNDLGAVADFANRAAPEAVTADLLHVTVGVWAALARTGRMAPTLHNVHQYIVESELNGIDADLAAFLETQAEITNVGAVENTTVAREVALKVIESLDVTEGTKVRIARSLEPEPPFAAEDLTPQAGTLFGALIAAGLLIDDQHAFTALRTEAWETRRAVANASKQFPVYLSDFILTGQELRDIATDVAVSAEARGALLRQLQKYVSEMDTEILNGLAGFALANEIELAWDDIQLMLKHRVQPRLMVGLIGQYLPALDQSDLLSVLQQLGGEYARLVDRQRQVKLPNDEAHEALLDRLRDLGVVGKYPQHKDPGFFRVFVNYGH